MGLYTAKSVGATPANPPAGYLRLYNDGTSWKYVNSSGAIFTLSTGVTAEEVQDIVGAFFADSSSIDVTYNDAGDVISAVVLASGVNHNALQNYVANQHIDHTTVSISAGAGLTGGGDISANRTISMPNVGAPGTYQSVTTDAQGRVTSGSNPTTLSGFGITDAQPLDGDLTAIATLSSTGLISRTGAGTVATRSVAAGTGVSVSNGDGVSGNPTVSLATVVTAGSGGSSSQVPVVTYNAQGQITAVVNTAISILSSAVTDFAATVRTTVMTGFSATNAAVTAADSLIVAIGKLQGQLDSLGAAPDPWTELSKAAISTNSSNVTFTNLTDLGIACVAGSTYYIELTLRFKSAATGTGITLTFNTSDTAAGSIAAIVNAPSGNDGTNSLYSGSIESFGALVTTPSVEATNTYYIANVKGVFICSVSGTLVPQFRSEVNGSAVDVGPGSIALYRKF